MSEFRVADLIRRGEAARDAARGLATGLLESELLWTPAPGRWGVAHCLEHLAATATGYRPGIDRALGESPAGTAVPIRPGVIGRRVIAAIGPGASFRLRAPGAFRPPAEPLPGALPRFLEAHEAFLDQLRAALARDTNTVKLASPVSPLLRLTLGEILALLTGHVERHLAQAAALRAHPRFPRRS